MSDLCHVAVASRETTLDCLLFPCHPINCVNEMHLTPWLGNLIEPQRLQKYQRHELGHFTLSQTQLQEMHQAPPSPLTTGPAGVFVLTDLMCPTKASSLKRHVLLRQPFNAKATGFPSRAYSSAVGGDCLWLSQKVIKNANINIELRPNLTKCQSQFEHLKIKNYAAAV